MTPLSSVKRFHRILLTGGSGFVGSYLAPMLAAAFPDAERVQLRHPPGPNGMVDGWSVAEADIADHEAIGALVSRLRPDLILHLAAQSSVGASAGSAEATWRVNFGGAFAMASACARAELSATLLFTSSAEVYGRSFLDGPATEETALQPQNAYARSKAAAEGVLADVLPQTTQLIVTRSFNHTGPGQDTRFVLPSFAAQIAAIEAGRQPPRIEVGNLDAERDFLDVRDVCDAYMRLLLAADDLPRRFSVIVASGKPMRIGDLLAILRTKAKTDFAIEIDPQRLRPSDIARAVGSDARLRLAVDWRPSTSIVAMLEALLEHERSKFPDTKSNTVS